MGLANSTKKNQEEIKAIFDQLDVNKNGSISATELKGFVPKEWKFVNELEVDGKVKLESLRKALIDNKVSNESLAVLSAMLRIEGSKPILTADQLALARTLAESGQLHLFSSWDEEAAKMGKPKKLMQSLEDCDRKYQGGLVEYIRKAKVLLKSSKEGKNPFDGYEPEVPVGASLKYGDEKFMEFESVGLKEIKGAAFVLVAGGLGERLGYGGIKVALPTEITTMTCYLDFYCQSILALQAKASAETKSEIILPFAIMTSGDTHKKTEELLKANNDFGLKPGQITLVKQDKVPALADNDAKFALDSEDKYKLVTKPHGHGDVHLLLHTSGLAEKWASSGVSYICFFQDTNGLVFNALTACIGVSKSLNLEVNSLTVPRRPGEAVGAICKLVPKKGSEKKELTINVEYNQLDALLKTTEVGGDVAGKDGYSPYPGNINVLIFQAGPYAANLKSSHGMVPEFVNPKYADADKKVFKKPTRLECMMQDYPRLCATGAKVGFTSIERWACFSAVKNNTKDAKKKADKTGFGECGCTGEADMYKINRKKLKIIGVDIDDEGKQTKILDIPCSSGARVSLLPSFAASMEDIKARFPEPKNVKISASSTLVLEGDITVKSLDLNGALIISAKNGAKVTIEEGKVENKGHDWAFIDPADTKTEEMFRIRGYTLEVKEEFKKEFTEGTWVIKGGKAEMVKA